MSGRERIAADLVDELDQAFGAVVEARAAWAVVARRAAGLVALLHAAPPTELAERSRWVAVRDMAHQLAAQLSRLEDDAGDAANIGQGDDPPATS